ncbi:regulatory protein RecX [Chryseobacterium chendengshani]|uniref:regulatory protein RecX n=1 Tax=unclassified Chryseobacterium TaxID=2593645 RepID=UPI001C64254F|nr:MULTISPECIES: regulatory protein RecX [unclassified Chryseobacterium]MBW7676599.1 RecX family transcriptional regulator [Chryseobacterium sp. LJ756]MBW8523141.1 RecX family transcriptional regulator [Chryseobacterium sp. LJ668]QYK15440.1 RecX family transcriptional regulator [Chryseobacterium sp. LJ668]
MENEKKLFTFTEIKQKLVNYCVYQDRCHAEVEQKMREFVLIPEAKEEILLYLMKENYLNEERFTRSYIRGKFNIKHWGKTKIKIHLKQKGITEKLITKCFDEIDDEDYLNIIKKIYENYSSKLNGLSLYQKKSKTIKYLLSRGFEYDMILQVTDN